MSAINTTIEAVADHTATLTTRPDGSVLLTLSKGETILVRKVFGREIMQSEQSINSMIHELVWDVKLAKGEVKWKEKDCKLMTRKIPTFTGEAIQLTAAKALFGRRKLKR
ncbi:MAG TPA: DUF3509 domain-containing protein [Pseudomonas sp.]|nr:DUF3509 domain-containing protein [Pseudomonas sp.]